MPTRDEIPFPTTRLPVVWVRTDSVGRRAGLLVWGRHATGWYAGACWPQGYSGQPHRQDRGHGTLITLWAAAADVRPDPAEDYGDVPRVQLTGPPDHWPRLPAWHPDGWLWDGRLQHLPPAGDGG